MCSKHCKVLTIAWCDMQSRDAQSQTVVGGNLIVVMLDIGVQIVNFKGFIVDSAHANWIVVMKAYGDTSPIVALVANICTCFPLVHQYG